MKKLALLITVVFFALCLPALAADVAVKDMPSETHPTGTMIMYIIKNPTGTAVDEKVTVQDLTNGISVLFPSLTIGTLTNFPDNGSIGWLQRRPVSGNYRMVGLHGTSTTPITTIDPALAFYRYENTSEGTSPVSSYYYGTRKTGAGTSSTGWNIMSQVDLVGVGAGAMWTSVGANGTIYADNSSTDILFGLNADVQNYSTGTGARVVGAELDVLNGTGETAPTYVSAIAGHMNIGLALGSGVYGANSKYNGVGILFQQGRRDGLQNQVATDSAWITGIAFDPNSIYLYGIDMLNVVPVYGSPIRFANSQYLTARRADNGADIKIIGNNDQNVTIVGTSPYGMFSDSLQLWYPLLANYGGTGFGVDRNSHCTAVGLPWTCCTGNGTGTCPDLVANKYLRVNSDASGWDLADSTGGISYPTAGIVVSTGTAWASSLSVPLTSAYGGTGKDANALNGKKGLVLAVNEGEDGYDLVSKGTSGVPSTAGIAISTGSDWATSLGVGTMTNNYLCTYSNSPSLVCNTNPATFALTGQTFYLGTTQVAINRTTGSLALTGITSIDGTASSLSATLIPSKGGTGKSGTDISDKTGYILAVNSGGDGYDLVLPGSETINTLTVNIAPVNYYPFFTNSGNIGTLAVSIAKGSQASPLTDRHELAVIEKHNSSNTGTYLNTGKWWDTYNSHLENYDRGFVASNTKHGGTTSVLGGGFFAGSYGGTAPASHGDYPYTVTETNSILAHSAVAFGYNTTDRVDGLWGGQYVVVDIAGTAVSLTGTEYNIIPYADSGHYLTTTRPAIGILLGGVNATAAMSIGPSWHTGILIKQDSITPESGTYPNTINEAINIIGGSTSGNKYAGIRMPSGNFSYGLDLYGGTYVTGAIRLPYNSGIRAMHADNASEENLIYGKNGSRSDNNTTYYVVIGDSSLPVKIGAIIMPNNTSLISRSQADDSDVALISLNTSNQVVLGGGTQPVSAKNLTLTDLTASLPVVTDSAKKLVSVSYATFKSSLSIAQADVSGLTTSSSPQFTSVYVGGTSALLYYESSRIKLAYSTNVFSVGAPPVSDSTSLGITYNSGGSIKADNVYLKDCGLSGFKCLAVAN